MARNKQAYQRTAQATADGYENFVARVGMQTPNQHSASTYRANFTSRNRMLVEWSYRGSWVIGEAVDAIPDDMTRKGIRITSEIDAKDRGILESQLDELQIWDALNDVLKWSRLYGGAVGFIMIEGQAPMTPLRLETIGEGKFKGILPLDRWMINPVLTRRIKEMGPDLGKPEFYDVVTTATGIPAWRIHHSRLIRFDGVTLPFQQKMTENEWGMSVVERIWDRLTAFDSATVGAAQLVYKAHLRTYSVEKLRELIALGGPAYEALLKNIDLIRQFQSIVNGRYDGSNDSVTEIMDALERYSEIITPWATKVAENFTADIARQNEKQWRQHSRNISAELRNMVDRAPVGQVMKSIVAEQIKYIKSLPLEAADRVYDIQNKAIEAVVSGGRAEPFAKEIAASGDVSLSRANLIARTELGRATGALDQARALSIGSNGYIWRTAEDGDVRHSHREMEGKFVEWGKPPTLDGMTGHAGELPNCRCYKEIVFPNPHSYLA